MLFFCVVLFFCLLLFYFCHFAYFLFLTSSSRRQRRSTIRASRAVLDAYAKAVESAESVGTTTNVLAAFEEFTRLSKSRNDRFTLDQFRTVCKQHGIRTDNQTMTDLFNKLDLDGDGTIDYEEFVYGALEGKAPVLRTQPRSPISDMRARETAMEITPRSVDTFRG